MAADDGKSSDFYAVLGLDKECTATELRNAYKKLAMKWHPDRYSAPGNSKYVEEAKKKFQAIQQAYSVLSDANKRFLYDVGVYDCADDEDEDGMGDFLNEMAAMMNQSKSDEKGGNNTFEELQELFNEMFQSNIEAFGSSSRSATPPMCSSSSKASYSETYTISNKRNSSEMSFSSSSVLQGGTTQFEGFCIGAGHPEHIRVGRVAGESIHGRGGDSRRGRGGGRSRRDGRKQKNSPGQNVSSSSGGFSGISSY